MLLDDYKDRLKTAGLLYVDVYPYSFSPSGEIRLLIFHRKADIPLPNIWQPISGKLHAGESYHACFLRQIEEKTGRRPEKLFVVPGINMYLDMHYDTVMLVPSAACQLSSTDVTIDRRLHTESRWVSLADFEKLVPFEFQVGQARKICEIAANPTDDRHINELSLVCGK